MGLGRSAVLEATFFYILAIVLGVIIIVIYIIFITHGSLFVDIENFFSNLFGTIFSGFAKV